MQGILNERSRLEFPLEELIVRAVPRLAAQPTLQPSTSQGKSKLTYFLSHTQRDPEGKVVADELYFGFREKHGAHGSLDVHACIHARAHTHMRA